MTVGAVGGLLATLLSGRLIQAIGTKPIIVWGVASMGLLSVVVTLAPTWPLLALAMFSNAMSFAITSIAMNIEADRVESALGRRLMSRCHGIWSAGMLLSTLIGAAARAAPVPAHLHILAMLPIVFLLGFTVIVRIDPAPRAPSDRADRPGMALPSRRTFLLVLFSLSGALAQNGVQSWSVIFMRDSYRAPDWVDTLSLPTYLVSMTVCRLLADGWTTRYGAVRIAVIMTLVTLAGILLVVCVPTVAMAMLGFALMGFGTAVTFPLIISAAARGAERSAAESVAAVIFLSSITMLGAPALMGWIAESWSIRVAFAAIIPTILVSLATRRILLPAERNA